MKSIFKRATALALSLTLLVSVLPVSVYAEDEPLNLPPAETMSDEEMQAFMDEFYQRNEENPGFFGDLIIGGLKFLGGKALDKGGEWAVKKAWDAIFGADVSNEDLKKMLEEMQGQLNKIERMLTNVMNEIKKQDYKQDIKEKLELSRYIDVSVTNAMKLFEDAESYEEKCAVLDKWYNTPLVNYENKTDLFEGYVRKISNSDGNNMNGDYFTCYDAFANLQWNFETQEYPFRQLQRERDIYILTKLAGLNQLYLEKEYKKATTPTKQQSVQRLKDKMQKEIQIIIDLYNKKKVAPPAKDVEKFHYQGSKVTFEIMRTVRNATYGSRFGNQFYHGSHTNKLREFMKQHIAEPKGYHLMTRGEAETLKHAADDTNSNVYDMLVRAGNIDTAVSDPFLININKANTPLEIGRLQWGAWRNAYILNANFKAADDREFWPNTLLTMVSCRGYGDTDRIVDEDDNTHPGRYKCTSYNPDNTEYFERRYNMIYVKDGNNAPAIDTIFEDDLEDTPDLIAYSSSDDQIFYNDELVEVDTPLISMNGRTCANIYDAIRMLGGNLDFDSETGKITCSLNEHTAVFTVGSADYTANGEQKTMDVTVFVEDKKVFIPVRPLAEALGLTVKWVEEDDDIIIGPMPGPIPDPTPPEPMPGPITEALPSL